MRNAQTMSAVANAVEHQPTVGTTFTGKEFIEGLKAVLNVLVGPVITLLASAVGFYFGSKQGESGGSTKTQNKPSP